MKNNSVFTVIKAIKFVAGFFLIFIFTDALPQDPWKNIYSRHAWEERDKWQKADRLIRLLKISSGSKVADIGCHEGYMTFKLAKAVGNKGLVYAVDVSAQKLEKVSEYATQLELAQVKVVQGKADDPHLPDSALDAVLILDTYHEMDHHDEMLQYIKTALKPGGRLLFCEPISESRRKLPRAEQEKKHELSMDHAVADLTRAGFRIALQMDNYIDRTKQKGDKMWVIVAVKN